MALAGVLGILGVSVPMPVAGADTGTISGAVYDDANRNGVRDVGEGSFAGRDIEVYDSAGRWMTGVGTDQGGNFSIVGLPTGTYSVRMGITEWWELREEWVPTTTGSLRFEVTVSAAPTASANFGLRRIVRSRNLGAPMSSLRTANGTLVESYNDAVTAPDIASHLHSGSLLGAEGPHVTVRFDFQSDASCTSSYTGSPGAYTSYSANVWVDYLSWVNDGDRVLFHEYGHAFSNYHEYLIQQDGTFAGYLEARGIAGDARLGTTRAWSPSEMIAEDYRLLFGSVSAQTYPQENQEVPHPAAVDGLATYLSGDFRVGADDGSPPPPPEPSPTPLDVTHLSLSPSPLSISGTATFTISAPASVHAVVIDGRGLLVRTLVSNAPQLAGTSTATWDRMTDGGRKAKAGSYLLVVTATGSDGTTASETLPFDVVDGAKSGGGKAGR